MSIFEIVLLVGGIGAGLVLIKFFNVMHKDKIIHDIARLLDGEDEEVEGYDFIKDKIKENTGIPLEIQERLASFEETVNILNDHKDTLTEHSELERVAVENVVNNVEEFFEAINQISNSAENLAHISDENSHSNQDNLMKLKEVVQEIQQLSKKVTVLLNVVRKLNENSNKISKTTEVLANVNNKVELLSLNAAIEAAKAEKHGKGFAVVAEEMRSLSDTTKENIGEIELIIKVNEAQSETILKDTKKIEGQFNEVKVNIEEVVKSFDKTSELIQESAAQTEETSAATQQLSSNSELILAQTKELQESSSNVNEVLEELNNTLEELSKMM